MRKQEALALAMCAATIAFAVAFVYPMLATQAVAWYYPLEHRWAYEAKPTGLAMDFFGRTFQAMIAWSLVFVVVFALARRLRVIHSRTLMLFTAWAVTITLLVMGHFAWTLYFRIPTPEPLPAWYQPR